MFVKFGDISLGLEGACKVLEGTCEGLEGRSGGDCGRGSDCLDRI